MRSGAFQVASTWWVHGLAGLASLAGAALPTLLPPCSAQAAAADADHPPPSAAPLQAEPEWEPLTGPLPPALIPPLAVVLLSTGLLIRCGCWRAGGLAARLWLPGSGCQALAVRLQLDGPWAPPRSSPCLAGRSR